MSKRLIITSDDFGLSTGVNLAVQKAWKDGILTNASIMPAGRAFDEAVEIAKRERGLQVGLHLTLVHGYSLLPKSEIPDLVDEDGAFTDNAVAAGMRYFFDKSLYQQLYKEIDAQFAKVADSGINLSHIDGHLNIHLHPTIFSILLELFPKYGIKSFRLSKERLMHNLKFDRRRLLGKTVESIIFHNLSRNAEKHLRNKSVSYASEVKGVLNSGRMIKSYIMQIIEGINDGLTEIYFHPGILPDIEITRRMPDYRHEEELAALTDIEVIDKIKRLGIKLQNYRGDLKC